MGGAPVLAYSWTKAWTIETGHVPAAQQVALVARMNQGRFAGELVRQRFD
jgi:hypothetical protein